MNQRHLGYLVDQQFDTSSTGLAPIAVLSFVTGGIALSAVIISLLLAEPAQQAQVWGPAAGRGPVVEAAEPSPLRQQEAVGAVAEPTTPAMSDRPARRTIVIPVSRPARTEEETRSLSPLAPTGTPDEPVKVYPSPKPDRSSGRRTLVELQDQQRTWPRLKPQRVSQTVEVVHAIDPSATYLVPDHVDAFASADDFTGGREALFADYAQAQQKSRAERAYSTLVLNRGESVSDMLVALGAEDSAVASLLSAADQVSPVSGVKPGMAFEYAFETLFMETEEGTAQETVLARIRFRPDSRQVVTAWRTADGGSEARIEELEVDHRYAAVGGVIRHSLFAAAQRSEVPPEIMVQFANLFLYDVDYARDIQSGDRYEAVYDVYFDKHGNYVSSGDIHFAGMSWRGARYSKGYYRFDKAVGMEIPYFDRDGESANRLLMKTPIEGARVTSSFGLRRHPISGFTKAHKGIDFGAPTGTPIMAAGDGVVVRAQRTGSFGHYIRIQHAKGYETAYAHLDGYARGVRKGKKVRQGDIVGYVGSTGRSTGPHLHYEVHLDGEAQNPMTLEVAGGRVLAETLVAPFGANRDFVDTIRVRPLTVAAATNQ